MLGKLAGKARNRLDKLIGYFQQDLCKHMHDHRGVFNEHEWKRVKERERAVHPLLLVPMSRSGRFGEPARATCAWTARWTMSTPARPMVARQQTDCLVDLCHVSSASPSGATAICTMRNCWRSAVCHGHLRHGWGWRCRRLQSPHSTWRVCRGSG